MSEPLPAKILVIGIDGADLDVIRPWLDAGDLPNLARIEREGTSGYLASTLPPISAPAWATFMTGRRPGRHGVFGFVREDEETGGTRVLSLADIRGKKLWEVFGDAGKRVGVVNLPVTWPPPEVDGLFVTGMLTPPGRPFTHPPEFQAEIEEKPGDYPTDTQRDLRDDPAKFLAHLLDSTATRGAAMRTAMDRIDWGLFVGIFTNTDRVQHHYWHGDMAEIREVFLEVDRQAGALIEKAGPDAVVAVVSDHGFAGVDRRIYVNRWLAREGYLRLRRVPAPVDEYEARRFNFFMKQPSLWGKEKRKGGLLSRLLRRPRHYAIDWERTRAYLYTSDSQGIHVNLRGRQPRGIVPPENYEALRDEIAGKLADLRFPGTGERVYAGVHRREEIYEGPYTNLAPDLVLDPLGDRYRIVSAFEPGKDLRQHGRPRGFHRRQGLLMASGPGVRRGGAIEGAGLADVMPTLLFAAGLPIPGGVDGAVLRGIFSDDLLAAREEVRQKGGDDRAEAAVRLDAKEQELLRRNLADLGYL